MSFILDALRKSEHDRQRQAGPALAEIPVAAPKSRSNIWAPAAVGLLLVNLVVVAVILLPKVVREPIAQQTKVVAPQPAPSATPPSPAPTTAGASPSETSPPVAAEPVAAPPSIAPPSAAPTLGPRPATGVEARNPLEEETSGGSPTLDPRMAAAASAPPGPPAVTRVPTARGSVVYEKLPDTATMSGRPTGTAATSPAGAGSALASADQLVAAGVPALNLDLHVYSTKPADRMVFINARKYREGDTLQEGPVVRQITPAGVVLEYQGRAYLLMHD